MAYDGTRDQYASAAGPSSPAFQATVVTPSDTVDLNPYAKALYIGVAGDVTVVVAGDHAASGTAVLFKAHPVGYMPVRVRRVNSTGTTTTNILALND